MLNDTDLKICIEFLHGMNRAGRIAGLYIWVESGLTRPPNLEQPSFIPADKKYGARNSNGPNLIGVRPVIFSDKFLPGPASTQSAGCDLVIAQCDERHEHDTEEQYQHAEQ